MVTWYALSNTVLKTGVHKTNVQPHMLATAGKFSNNTINRIPDVPAIHNRQITAFFCFYHYIMQKIHEQILKTSKSFSRTIHARTQVARYTIKNTLQWSSLYQIDGTVWYHMKIEWENSSRPNILNRSQARNIPSDIFNFHPSVLIVSSNSYLSPAHYRFSIPKLGNNFKDPTKLIASPFCNVYSCSQNNQLPRFQVLGQLLPLFTNIEKRQVGEKIHFSQNAWERPTLKR